jgi:hypothetical protein
MFSGVTSASGPIATEALTAPTGLTATGTPTIALSWAASTSPKFTGTRVFRATTSGGPYAQVAQLASVATTTYSDTPGSGTFYYVVEAYYSGGGANWTSPMSNQASAQVPYPAHVADGQGTQTTAPFSTAAAAEVVAFVGSDGPSPSPAQTVTVSGAGLAWSLVVRTNTQLGTAEVWAAHAATALTNVTVTSTQSSGNYYQSLTVVAFQGLVGTGATGTANAGSGAQSVSLTTTHPESVVYGVGDDWDAASNRTLGPGQTMVHQYEPPVGDTYWAQYRTAAVPVSGTNVTLNDTAPTTDRWNYSAVEIRAS